jgi:hypothetical protein
MRLGCRESAGANPAGSEIGFTRIQDHRNRTGTRTWHRPVRFSFDFAGSISGDAELDVFMNSWRGTMQWTARSPFRPGRKRKNWFVGSDILEPVEETGFNFERSAMGDDAGQRTGWPTR